VTACLELLERNYLSALNKRSADINAMDLLYLKTVWIER